MKRTMISILSLQILAKLLAMTPETLNAHPNPEPEKYISKILQKKTPYTVEILDTTFTIHDNSVYPPGELTKMFAHYVIEHGLVQNKVVADIGAATFALGILAAKNGAKQVIGIDIEEAAVKCAHENIINNHVEDKATIIQGNGILPLLPTFQGKIDLILCGPPWSSISAQAFEKISPERKALSRSFYDVENELIVNLLSQGPLLLAPEGKIFITACLKIIDRIKALCTKYAMKFTIVEQADIHNDGNMHYILEITK